MWKICGSRPEKSDVWQLCQNYQRIWKGRTGQVVRNVVVKKSHAIRDTSVDVKNTATIESCSVLVQLAAFAE